MLYLVRIISFLIYVLTVFFLVIFIICLYLHHFHAINLKILRLADYFSPFLLNSTNYNTVLHSIDSLSDEEELPILSKSKITTTSSAVGKSTSTTSGSYV